MTINININIIIIIMSVTWKAIFFATHFKKIIV